MKTSPKGIALIKAFEGLRLSAYQCDAHRWTIGYGHTEGVRARDVITGAQAEANLEKDLAFFERGISKALIDHDTPQYKFDAMVSLAFNIGLQGFLKSSVMRHWLAGHNMEAADAFLLFDIVLRKHNAGLARRRKAERSLFLGIGEFA